MDLLVRMVVRPLTSVTRVIRYSPIPRPTDDHKSAGIESGGLHQQKGMKMTIMLDKCFAEVETKLTELKPKLDFAYNDARDSGGVEYLWDEFYRIKYQYNTLIEIRQTIIKKKT